MYCTVLYCALLYYTALYSYVLYYNINLMLIILYTVHWPKSIENFFTKEFYCRKTREKVKMEHFMDNIVGGGGRGWWR